MLSYVCCVHIIKKIKPFIATEFVMYCCELDGVFFKVSSFMDRVNLHCVARCCSPKYGIYINLCIGAIVYEILTWQDLNVLALVYRFRI